jgi:tetratricopeptide (TPR) repeat protein
MDQVAGQANTAFMPLGVALMHADRCRNEGRLIEAEAICRRVLEAQPNLPEAEHLIGVIAYQNGKLGEAIKHVQRAIKLAPQVALFHANLGEMYRLSGRLKLAADEARRALAIERNMPAALSNLGVALYELKDYKEAARSQRKAIAVKPDFAEAHSDLGNALHALRRFEEAVAAYRRAIELKPDYADAWANLGVALYELKDYKEAARSQRKAIAAKPDFAEAHSNLGNALHALRRFEEAIAAYRRAIELKPDYADAWANLGAALHHSGDFDESMVALRRAIALAPHHANAHSGLGILLLMRGDLGEGWDEYEWRLRLSERKGPRFPENPWQGENLVGKHIYVQAEHGSGFGDTLHFARYIPPLAALAGAVTLRVQQALMTLLRESLPGITVLGDRGDPAPYHCDTVLLSLPRLFKTRLETIPADVPYLHAPAEAVQRWKKRLARMAGVKVGVVWAGNPDHVNDSRRSIDLTLLAPLFAVRGTSFASLQVGPRSADLKKLKRRKHSIADLSPAFGDFAESAGAVSALDLVITVDTSVAHLAGALGKPVWVLLPWVTDWRWMLNREDNPWYPTIRLFRQKKGEDWANVIARAAKQLKAVARGDDADRPPQNTTAHRLP